MDYTYKDWNEYDDVDAAMEGLDSLVENFTGELERMFEVCTANMPIKVKYAISVEHVDPVRAEDYGSDTEELD